MPHVVVPLEKERLDLGGVAVIVEHNRCVNAEQTVEALVRKRVRVTAGFTENHEIFSYLCQLRGLDAGKR
jgi:hypothetical protein